MNDKVINLDTSQSTEPIGAPPTYEEAIAADVRALHDASPVEPIDITVPAAVGSHAVMVSPLFSPISDITPPRPTMTPSTAWRHMGESISTPLPVVIFIILWNVVATFVVSQGMVLVGGVLLGIGISLLIKILRHASPGARTVILSIGAFVYMIFQFIHLFVVVIRDFVIRDS